jgi:phage terminase large subunit-like protein
VNSARLVVPTIESEPWPTLGPEVCDWVEANLVHGPGDLLGQPVTLIDEIRLFIYRAYEVYPRGHALAGRRRFKRAVLSRRKGVGKTEVAAWLALAELDPQAPVRCDGFREVEGEWIPVGRPVRDPYIPMVAVTEEQTEDLAYSACYEILANCDLGNDYDIGIERIMHGRAPGKIQALASAPNARDGARTTFQHFDETHLFVQLRLRNVHATMSRNIPKRKAADPWSLETTTAFAPGEGSVAEAAKQYARDIVEGRIKDARFLYDHRQAADHWNLKKPKEFRAALEEASGDAAPYTDFESILALTSDPSVDPADVERFWLNREAKPERKWMHLELWASRAEKRRKPHAGAKVVLAFDGSYRRDSTALIGATVTERPHIFTVKVWERPITKRDWRVPRGEVLDTVDKTMKEYQVVELAPDPPGWHTEIETWEQTYGEVVVRFDTNQPSRLGPACDEFYQAVADDLLSHDDHPDLTRHVGNCIAVVRRGFTVVTKAAPDSPEHIDGAVGAIIAHHRARWHAQQKPKQPPRFISMSSRRKGDDS